MALFAILGILIIFVSLIIAAVIFFVIRRDERKGIDKNEDVLDS